MPPPGRSCEKLIDSLAAGLIGQGRNNNQTFQVGQQDLSNLASVTDVLQARDLELRRIVEALTKITQTLATDQQRANYPDLLAHSDTVLKTLIAEDADVAAGIDRMNQFFGVLDQGLAGRQADLQQIFADLPVTVSNLDALSATLAPQGQIGLKIVRAAAPGVVGGDLIFGSQPTNNTYSNDMYTRVMPSQGCLQVNNRNPPDASGQSSDGTTPVRGAPGAADPLGMCTLPVFAGNVCADAANPVGMATCVAALAGSLCVIENLGSGICGVFTGAAVAAPQPVAASAAQSSTTAPQRGPLGLPTRVPSAGDPAVNSVLRFLLK